eukprot:15342003-Ditylum_brightwellii.AAC.1
MSTCKLVARVNTINESLAQFPSRDDMTFQVKLAGEKIMDILENAMPKTWQKEMRTYIFDCMAKGQANFIQFLQNIESLDPPKDRKAQKDSTETSSMANSNSQIPKKKQDRKIYL